MTPSPTPSNSSKPKQEQLWTWNPIATRCLMVGLTIVLTGGMIQWAFMPLNTKLNHLLERLPGVERSKEKG